MTNKRPALVFLAIAVGLTVALGVIYVVGQQSLRMGANDPQRELAKTAAFQLDAGLFPAEVVNDQRIDIAQSPEPFVVVYDSTGAVKATDGEIDGHDPFIPEGVLAAAHANGSNAVTWQPREGVRVATVSIPWRDGTVMAGRSLRAVEEQEDTLLRLVVIGLLAAMIIVAIAYYLVDRRSRRVTGQP